MGGWDVRNFQITYYTHSACPRPGGPTRHSWLRRPNGMRLHTSQDILQCQGAGTESGSARVICSVQTSFHSSTRAHVAFRKIRVHASAGFSVYCERQEYRVYNTDLPQKLASYPAFNAVSYFYPLLQISRCIEPHNDYPKRSQGRNPPTLFHQ